VAKQSGQEHATLFLENEMIAINNDVEGIIKERLATAANKQAKAFELEIENYHAGSFFGLVQKMKEMTDEQFIESSIEIAHLIAESQTKNSIPGGYLFIIEAIDKNSKMVYIAIKAELHEGLRFEINNNAGFLRYFDDIFMSPQQKLYKFGIIYELPADEVIDDGSIPYPNDKYGCFLYDSQFSIDSKPAEYFFKDFLGFTIETNPKIQSKKFYNNTENFIKTRIPESEKKDDMMKVLKHEFLTNEEPEIVPRDFSDMYFHDEEVKSAYQNEVIEYLPEYVIKDTSLIKSQLEKKKMNFPHKVTISGPNNTFEYNIQIIKDKTELEELDPESPDYTIIKVLGKPYQGE
jgi:hypothetical protein